MSFDVQTTGKLGRACDALHPGQRVLIAVAANRPDRRRATGPSTAAADDTAGLARTIATATAVRSPSPEIEAMALLSQEMRGEPGPAGDDAAPAGAVPIRVDAHGLLVVAVRRRSETGDHALVADAQAWPAAGSS